MYWLQTKTQPNQNLLNFLVLFSISMNRLRRFFTGSIERKYVYWSDAFAYLPRDQELANVGAHVLLRPRNPT